MGTIRGLEMVVQIFLEDSGNGWPLPARSFEIPLFLFLVSRGVFFRETFCLRLRR